MKPLPAQLKSWRARRKLTQAGAADRLGVSPRTLQDWEQARRTPRGLARGALLERIK